MDFKQNPRFAYQGIRGRPDFAWPGNKKLAVYVALCVEHVSYGSGLGLPYSPGSPIPITGAGVNMATGSAPGDCSNCLRNTNCRSRFC
jgi:hypothetical protein